MSNATTKTQLWLLLGDEAIVAHASNETEAIRLFCAHLGCTTDELVEDIEGGRLEMRTADAVIGS